MAYAVRISDWSSDVCASDLFLLAASADDDLRPMFGKRNGGGTANTSIAACDQYDRSEEHTSELQSLMRISYAVFCLKKKKNKHYNRHRHNSDASQIIA